MKNQLSYLLSLPKTCFAYNDVRRTLAALVGTGDADRYADQYVDRETPDLWQHVTQNLV